MFNGLWSALVVPFGYIMRFCYGLFNSYGIALFLYAIITRIILFPLSIKQQKNQISMLKLKPYQDELLKKYGGDKQRYQQELMSLYERHGYNPTSSCLPTFIQLPVIMLIYTIVRRPLTYLAGMSLSEIWAKMQPFLTNEAFKKATTENFHQFELQLFSELSGTGELAINSKFLGIFDLAVKPSEFLSDGWFGEHFWLILIPILAGVSGYFAGVVSQKMSATNPTNDPAGASSMKMMNIMMPLISVIFSWNYTAALGLYWIASNIVAMGQTVLLNKMYSPKKALEEVEESLRSQKEKEKEKRRLAAEKRAQYQTKNSKKKRAMNAQYVEKNDAIDITKENTEDGN